MTKKHQLAWITGASSGIGAALARRLALEEIPLFLTGRDETRLSAVAEEVSKWVPVKTAVADLELASDRDRLVHFMRETAPDLVINNAGYGLYGDALDHPIEAYNAMLTVNVQALMELTLEAGRTCQEKKQSGVVVNVSSVAGFQAFPSCAVYAATKAYVNSFSESLDHEWAPLNVRVLAACPGQVTTQFSPRASGKGQIEDKPHAYSMTAEFAADEVWRQISQGIGIHIFDWRYRFMLFLSRYVLPRQVVSKVLRSNISRRIKIKNH